MTRSVLKPRRVVAVLFVFISLCTVNAAANASAAVSLNAAIPSGRSVAVRAEQTVQPNTQQGPQERTQKSISPIQPIMLLPRDVTMLKLNRAVREIAVSTAQNPMVNQFVTLDSALAYLSSEFEKIDGFSPKILDDVTQKIRSFVTQQHYLAVSPQTIAELSQQDLSLAAQALLPAIGQPVPAQYFSQQVQQSLEQASVQKEESDRALSIAVRTPQETLRYAIVNDATAFDVVFPSVDASVTDCLGNLANTAYPSANGLSMAVENLLSQMREIGLAAVKKTAGATDKPTPGVAIACPLSDDMIKRFQADADPVDSLDSRGEHGAGNYACSVLTESEIGPDLLLANSPESCDICNTETCHSIADYVSQVQNAVLSMAIKPFLRSELSEIELSTLPGCGECALPLKGTTIGFYPYWLASEAYQQIGFPSINPGYLNFGVFSRVAYFALPLGSDNTVSDQLHWASSRLFENYLRELQRFNVQRDIVVVAQNWKVWRGTDDIRSYAESHYKTLQSIQEQAAHWGGINGVIVYFNDYGRGDNANAILTYMSRLHDVIQQDDALEKLELRLLLDIQGLENQKTRVGASVELSQSYFAKLTELFMVASRDEQLKSAASELEKGDEPIASDLIDQTVPGLETPKVKNILVFLNEPSSEQKKRLRMQLENEFKGEARVEAQQKIIPVLGRLTLGEESAEPHRQFIDDLAYLKYNFGGIGLWSLPLTPQTDKGKANIENPVMSIFNFTLKLGYGDTEVGYVDTENMGWLAAALQEPAATEVLSVCAYACPNRIAVLWMLVVLIVFNLIFYALYNTHCPTRKVMKAHPVTFLLLRWSPVLLALLVLGCNPFFYPYATPMLAVGALSMLAISGYRSYLKMADKLERA
ncbi:hypothetical protein [Teredinibacter turnerae]|uniref:hypothetical protein n=1 Tax=Teredinibacter turnerae TaxID=2426 RepID=UPI000415BC8E|nr:hypothetical protein [Teredinibacter turnerae]